MIFMKISINSDDPGLFGTDTNLDFFATVFSMEFDLIDVKRSIVDSIECSLMSKETNENLVIDFKKKWGIFIETYLN